MVTGTGEIRRTPTPEIIEFLEENWHNSRKETLKEYVNRGYGKRDLFYSDLNYMVREVFPVKCAEQRDEIRTDLVRRYAGIYDSLMAKKSYHSAADILDKIVKLTGVAEPEKFVQEIQTGPMEVQFDFGVGEDEEVIEDGE